MESIAAVVEAAGPKPVNVLVGGPGRTVAELAAAGVRRGSVGAALARAAWGGFVSAAQAIGEDGAFQPFAPIAPFKGLNAAFEE